MARRIFVISDLHLGGDAPCMMSRPRALADFLFALPARCRPGEVADLVIAGDFLDFLAVPPLAAWTPDPVAAVAKLDHTRRGPCAPVFDALARHAGPLTVLVGNHDVELALPEVQDALVRGLGRPVHFVDDGQAWRAGGALVEHGNRYDGANINDWLGLTYLRAARSRLQEPEVPLEVSAGSELVERVVSPLKAVYPFIDLLQPTGYLQLMLFIALEPSVLADAPKLRRTLTAKAAEFALPARVTAGRHIQAITRGLTVPVAAESSRDLDLEAAFGEALRTLQSRDQPVSFTDWIQLFRQNREDGLAWLLINDMAVPDARLAQVQVIARRLLADDAFRLDAPDGPYGEAAGRMHAAGAEVVVMGHTHLARHHGEPGRATYINTGTWADIVHFPKETLVEGATGREALRDFLGRLLADRDVRSFEPHYADLRLDGDGHVVHASLEVP